MNRTKTTWKENRSDYDGLYCMLSNMFLNKWSRKTATEVTCNVWKKESKYSRYYLHANKQTNIWKDSVKNQRLTDAENEMIKEQISFDI